MRVRIQQPSVTSTEPRLRKLAARYRSLISSAVAAKAHYLSLEGEPSATAAGIARAKWAWQNLEAQKAGIAAQMHALEDLNRRAIA